MQHAVLEHCNSREFYFSFRFLSMMNTFVMPALCHVCLGAAAGQGKADGQQYCVLMRAPRFVFQVKGSLLHSQGRTLCLIIILQDLQYSV